MLLFRAYEGFTGMNDRNTGSSKPSSISFPSVSPCDTVTFSNVTDHVSRRLESAKTSKLPVSMRATAIIQAKEAARRASYSPETIRSWCKKHGIGRRPAGTCDRQISALAIELLLDADFEMSEKFSRVSGESHTPDTVAEELGGHLGSPPRRMGCNTRDLRHDSFNASEVLPLFGPPGWRTFRA
jgi:hypothetical protein